MSDIRRPADTRTTRQPAADARTAAPPAALENLAAELAASRAGAVLLAGAAGAPAASAAEVLAASLGASVVRVDLEAVVSKYIGDTEKHLDAVFRDAETAGAVLLFDEADALFGTRTDVKDAHDRYAGHDLSALLARIEAYPGLALLATTTATVDPGKIRRLRRIIDYTPQ
jgi:vesicle-fusing ATPase